MIVSAIGAAMAASSIAPQMWMIFGVLLVLIGLGTMWPLLAMWGVSCTLRFDRKRMTENEQVTVRLLVKNRFWFPVWGLSLQRGFFVVDDEAYDDGRDSAIAVSLARIPAAATSEFTWDFIPVRRGVYPLEKPILSCGFPFGLWFSEKEVSIERQIIVWPETYRLGSLPPVRGASQLVSETNTDRSGTHGEKIGVRPYQEGDSLRLVHWGQTARFDKLIVCEQQTPSRHTVDIVVDWNDVESNEAAALNEACLRIGASICEEFHSHGYEVRFQLAKLNFDVDARGSSFRRLMDRLADLNPQDDGAGALQESVFSKTENGFFITASDQADLERGAQWKSIFVAGAIDDDQSTKGWMVVENPNELKETISRLWQKNCQTSWQVSG